MSSTAVRLAEILRKVRRAGDFCVGGTTELLPPSLSVDGVGLIALPLLSHQAEQLVAAAERAPYGLGPDTIIDTSVRNTWQIGPDRVRIGGRHWPRTLATILGQVADGLGVSDAVEAEFYKLLIYDQGSFFVSHRDTEKSHGMFATLVVVLPSVCADGELVVRHKDHCVKFDLRADDPAEAVFAAFYADCLHEVLPVTSGHRLTLVYNLIRHGNGKALQPPDYTSEQHEVATLLRLWRGQMDQCDNEGNDVPEKLVYPLEHAYTAPELGFATLKGADAAAAGVLAVAAPQANCALHLALVTLEEFGSAEYSENSHRRRRWSQDDEGNGEFEVAEVDDWHIALSDWCAEDGNPVSWGEIPVSEDELSPPDPFHDLKPDELHFEEASGNAGVSFERRYRRAALVVWPNDRSFAVLTQAGLGVTVPHLLDLARRWADAGAIREAEVWRQAHELASYMIDEWPEHDGADGSDNIDSNTTGMLTALTRLGDTERIGAFLTRVIGTGMGYAKRDNPAIIAALGLLPLDQARAMVRHIVVGNAAKRFAACANLLAELLPTASVLQGTELRDEAASLLSAMPSKSGSATSFDLSRRSDKVDADFVADLLIALSLMDAELADQAVVQILDNPRIFDLDQILVPAARDKLRTLRVAEQPAIARLRTVCLVHLRTRIALPLAAPTDWRRPSTVGCRCSHCAELSRFLADRVQSTWIFRAAAPDRTHVEGTIRTARCDVHTTTEQRGRPYSLICTKNQASYERKLAQREQDLRDEASLSG